MADVDFKDLTVHAIKDAEAGLLHVVADIEGALVPLATHKLGSVLAWIEHAKADGPTIQPAVSTPTDVGGNDAPDAPDGPAGT